jgi:eukaryotic-like serine/threonine-protein kinase
MASDANTLDDLQPSGSQDELGRLGHYRVLGVLGKGGMGQVFRAEDVRLKRQVALKVMNKRFAAMPHSRKRFLEEARAMAAVHHDNVVTIFEVGETAGTPYMAMELLSGSTLEPYINSGKPHSPQWILEIASQLASGLSAAHRQGIVHRDIKPGNIWIEEPSGRAKVLDFGLALATGPVDSQAGRGTVTGTPGYLSPEQARGEPLDDRTDLYSLGVVLYQLACSRLPSPAKTLPEQLIKILAHQPDRPDAIQPSVPQPLADLIMRLLAKEPRERPRSAEALTELIAQAAAQLEESAQAAARVVIHAPTPTKARLKKPKASDTTRFRDKRLWGAAAAMIVLASGLMLTLRHGESPAEREAATRVTGAANPAAANGAVVLARTLDVLALADVPVGSTSITSGEHARFKVELANRAASPETDPRAVNRDARVIAQIVTYLRSTNPSDRAQRLTPGFPRKLPAAMLPAPGQMKLIDIDFVSSTLPAGDFEVIFELQSPSGTLVGTTTSAITISENLATIDLLGFETIRTERGRGADTFVVQGSDEGSGAGPAIDIDHQSKPDSSRPPKHAYLRFDLGRWAERRAEIDRAILLMTLEPGGHKGKSTIVAYGVPPQMPKDWIEKGDNAISWETSPSQGNIESYPFLGRAEFDNSGGTLEKQPDEIRLFGPGLDDYLRSGSGELVTILLVRTSSGDKPTRLVSREGGAGRSPALALRAVKSN